MTRAVHFHAVQLGPRLPPQRTPSPRPKKRPAPDALRGAEARATAQDDRAAVSSDVLAALNFAVVGIGASAGGLEALTSLLRALPADTGMAFVVISHLSP